MTSEPPEQPAPAGEPAARETAAAGLAPRKLHPAGAVVSALDNVREAAITLVVVLVLGSSAGRFGLGGALALAVGGALLALATGYVSWRRERYAVVDGAIRHRSGVIAPDETVVPIARVHSIDTSEGPVQRLFGVHELHVQTAGGGADGEIVLRAVSADAARELRAACGLAEPPAADVPEWRLSTRALLATALTAPQVGILVPILGGGAALLNRVLDDGAGEGLLVQQAPTDPRGIALLVGALAVAAWAVSFAGAFVTYAGFAIARDGGRLRIRRGMLQRRAASVPLRRVHALTVVEGPLRRPFGLCTVRLETAGYGSDPVAARTLFPLLRLADADALIAELVPALGGGLGALERPPPRARRRYALPRAGAGAAAGAALTLAWTAAWPAIPLLAAAGALDGLHRFRNAGWRLAGGRLAVRGGALARRTLVARADRLQDHGIAQSPLRRRARLADVAVTVASGTGAGVAALEQATAARLFDDLRPAVARP